MSTIILMSVFTLILAGCGAGKKTTSSQSNESKGETTELTMAVMQVGNVDDVKLVEEEINKISKEKLMQL
ncbi:hypothetical protein ACI2OX_03175 [Bacillus sp. N9]